MTTHANSVIERCRWIASRSEEIGRTTRTFLSPPMRDVHLYLRIWMEECGMSVSIDPAGNLRGTYGEGPKLLIGSHLDTVPDAGAYDGVLGVVLGIALVELLQGKQLPFQIEVIGFSEEEGVRFGVPFIGSRAVIGDAIGLLHLKDTEGMSVSDAVAGYGLSPERMGEAATDAVGYLEFHIEQGPVLESLGLPLGVVDAIAGQSRLDVTFTGHSNHAGTTPMALRRDALAAVAEWIGIVEQEALSTPGLMATVGHIEATPNVRNAINGQVLASLDVRHSQDPIRRAAVAGLLQAAQRIGDRRQVVISHRVNLDQDAVPMQRELSDALARAVAESGHVVHRMTSGAGHDAMIVARRMPTAMLFLRSPGGISHHPDESILVDDVAAALAVGLQFLTSWEAPLV